MFGMKDAILKAIKIAGAKSIADACNEISVQAVHKWAINAGANNTRVYGPQKYWRYSSTYSRRKQKTD